ncbi:MAG: RNA-protein complex protein Nop10 [Nitrososphaerota archaeon]|nr:RNA-protein complex protein Nop10 [Nitrososphaerota archaeon]MDG7026937.1 RNA-protein complex protein Nop10 [Nitrososphaerota archaeon]MDG7030602.1 RNA-protein complex protein Nop10 [Nitrososphaerota archaeon]
MKSLMLKCSKCSRYTLAEQCKRCGERTVTVHPARYSPDDRYARYRTRLAYADKAEPTVTV